MPRIKDPHKAESNARKCDFLESSRPKQEDKNISRLEVSMATAAINFFNVFFMLGRHSEIKQLRKRISNKLSN